jgi:amidohydrolase
MVGRSVEATRSGLITVAHIESGTTNNIIPPSAFMEGTIRAHDELTRETLQAKISQVAEGMSAAHGCTCTTHITPGYPVTINNDAQADLVASVSRELLGEDKFMSMPRAVMGAEDFSYVLQHVPGAMAFLGVCPDDENWQTAAPNHSNLMRVNEGGMRNGVALYAAMALVG